MNKYNNVWDCQVSQFEDPQDINKYYIHKILSSSDELKLDKVGEFMCMDNPAGRLIWGANIKAKSRKEASIKFKELLADKKKKDITDFLTLKEEQMYTENNEKQPFAQKDSDNELNKVLEFLCKRAKEKDIHIDFSPAICDLSFPTFKVTQYRTNPKNDKTYKITQMVDVDDLRIKNVTFKQFIDEIVKNFDDQFNDMLKEV